MGIKEEALRLTLNKTVDYLVADPETRVPKIMDMVDTAMPDSILPGQRKLVREAFDQQSNWYALMMKIMKSNPNVVPRLMKAFMVNGTLVGWGRQEKMREKHQCNIPWAILLDPTSACNLHCTGCWAAEYGHKLNLTYEDIDSIIKQGKELGCYIYIYTGGEPLVRKKDLIRLCEAHPDCAFLCFTNATLIDDAFAEEMIRVGNFVPAISAEGFEEATDSRRGEGVFAKVAKAMAILREKQLPFGVSCCYTAGNWDSIASEEFFDWLIDQGALFAWMFTYMPVGVNAVTELMVTPEQRIHLMNFIREMRKTKPLFTMDFQHDGEFVGGCIAGGRRYLHINANGDVEPCVFAHYSNVNIHDVSLLDALKSPIFMEYYRRQPFSENLLRPCPILENKDALAEMVECSGACSTDLEHAEDARDLCAKCHASIEAWTPVSDQIWNNPNDPLYAKRHSNKR